MADYSLRFDDATMQANFIAVLSRDAVSFALAVDGAVECTTEQWIAVNSVAHTIRDDCFRWYFSWCQTPEETAEFLIALKQSGLPFHLEHHKDQDVFLLSKAHEAAYQELLI